MKIGMFSDGLGGGVVEEELKGGDGFRFEMLGQEEVHEVVMILKMVEIYECLEKIGFIMFLMFFIGVIIRRILLFLFTYCSFISLVKQHFPFSHADEFILQISQNILFIMTSSKFDNRHDEHIVRDVLMFYSSQS